LPTHGGVAQLVERLHGMQEVVGSIPIASTKRSLFEYRLAKATGVEGAGGRTGVIT
jgi:hypothetical protein